MSLPATYTGLSDKTTETDLENIGTLLFSANEYSIITSLVSVEHLRRNLVINTMSNANEACRVKTFSDFEGQGDPDAYAAYLKNEDERVITANRAGETQDTIFFSMGRVHGIDLLFFDN